MPILPITISDLKKTTAHFDFLLTAPYVKIETIPPNDRSCTICQKPFDNDVWELGISINRPVELECGHRFHIRCLAHLIFAANFRNRCAVCRVQVIPDSFEKNPSRQSWKVVVPLLRTLMMFEGDDVAINKVKALEVLQTQLAKKGLMSPVPRKHMLRVMVLYVEFLGRFCGGVQQLGYAQRALAAERMEQSQQEYFDTSRKVREREIHLRGLRAQEEERLRDERGRELRELERELSGATRRLRHTRQELEVARQGLRDAAGDFPEGKIGSALMMLGAMISALVRTLSSKRSWVLVSAVIFGMALGRALYDIRNAL